MHFEITKNKKEEFVLVLRAKNGEVVVKTEGYVSRSHAKKIAGKILDLTISTEIRDLTIVPKTDKSAKTTKSPAKKVEKKTIENEA